MEQNIDFDQVIDRKNTDCLKYDFAVKRGKPENVLPLWVADMDFKASSLVLDEIHKRVEHGIFGYTESTTGYFEALSNWMRKRHNWEVKEEWIVKTPGVVFALALAIRAYTKKGEGVLIQQPVYYPFKEVIEDNDRFVVSNDLILGEDGIYHIDFEDFEKKIIDNHIKLFILCSPHNPVGRVWIKEELLKIGEICLKHKVIVVSDEIHQDFTYTGYKHSVFANLSSELEQISVVCTSPAKTFNLAGLQISNIFIPNKKLRREFLKEKNAIGYSQLNTVGLTACEAAYRYGEVWHKELLTYLEGNLLFLRNYLQKNLPEIKLVEPQGTYLVWLDCRGFNLAEEELEKFIVKDANLWLDSGSIFGSTGEGFERINIACPRSVLKQALEQLSDAWKRYSYK